MARQHKYTSLPATDHFSPTNGLLFTLARGDTEYPDDNEMELRVPKSAQHLFLPKSTTPPSGSGGAEYKEMLEPVAIPVGVPMEPFQVLESVDSIFVQRVFDMKEMFWERNNKYKVCKADPAAEKGVGEQFMYVSEESSCVQRIFCGNYRATTVNLHNGMDKEAPVVLNLFKPMNVGNKFCPCACRPEMQMKTATGDDIGKVVDPFACCSVTQTVFNKDGEPIAKVVGSVCQKGMMCPCVNITFSIQDMSGNNIGAIEKVFNGCGDICLGINLFRIDFPMGSNAYFKAMLIGAAFLLDFQYFEKQDKSSSSSLSV